MLIISHDNKTQSASPRCANQGENDLAGCRSVTPSIIMIKFATHVVRIQKALNLSATCRPTVYCEFINRNTRYLYIYRRRINYTVSYKVAGNRSRKITLSACPGFKSIDSFILIRSIAVYSRVARLSSAVPYINSE